MGALRLERVNRITTRQTIRHYLPSLLNNTSDTIINSMDTISILSFKKRVKKLYIGAYSDECNKPNCYICNRQFKLYIYFFIYLWTFFVPYAASLAFSLKRQHGTMWNTTLHPYKSINSLSSHWEYITIKLSIIDFHTSPIIQWLSILIGNFVIIIHYKHKKYLIWSSMLV